MTEDVTSVTTEKKTYWEALLGQQITELCSDF